MMSFGDEKDCVMVSQDITNVFSIWVFFTSFSQFTSFLGLLRFWCLFTSPFSFAWGFSPLFSTSTSCFFCSFCFSLLSFKCQLWKYNSYQIIKQYLTGHKDMDFRERATMTWFLEKGPLTAFLLIRAPYVIVAPPPEKPLNHDDIINICRLK